MWVVNKHGYYFNVAPEVDLSGLVECQCFEDFEDAAKVVMEMCGIDRDEVEEPGIEIFNDHHVWVNGVDCDYEDGETPTSYINNFIM